MEITIAEHAGFCYGVKRAVQLAESLAETKPRVTTLGPLIHNPQVVERLRSRGVRSVGAVEEAEAEAGALVIRAHGVPPEVADRAREKGLEVFDATCPYVRKSQLWAKRLTEDGYQVIVVGEPDHAEIIGVLGWTGGKGKVVETPGDIAALPDMDKAAVIPQTTLKRADLDRVVEALRPKAKELRVVDTICSATADRQDAARRLASQVDIMLVVGGHESSNTRRLAQVSEETGVETHFIETADEIKLQWFRGKTKVGITAGASTPDWIIKEVVDRVSDEENELTQEPEAAATEENADQHVDEHAEEHTDEQDFARALAVIKQGDVVTGKVVQVGPDFAMVDVGYKSEGYIPLNDLSHRPLQSADQAVKVGDEIKVFVVNVEGHEGGLKLSKRKADEVQAWEKVKESFEKGETLDAEVVEVVKGGLVLDIGLRGFMPASQVERGYASDLGKHLGQKLRAKVIEIDRSKNRVILSRKTVLEEERRQAKDYIWTELAEGQIREGTVKSLTDFGAFVDLGGVDGLIHVSELSWGRVKHPSEVLKEGDKVKVMVLRLDREKGKVSLGLRQTLPDPWAVAAEKYPEGSTVTGTVVRLTTFGAFVELEPGIDGLIHISQLADRRVAKPDEVVNPGQKVRVKVLQVKPGEKRISLSLREAEGDYEE